MTRHTQKELLEMPIYEAYLSLSAKKRKPKRSTAKPKKKRLNRKQQKKKPCEEVDPGCYAQRNRVLRSMGIKNYRAYLHSLIWREIRKRVRERDHGRCRICGTNGMAAHHTDYSFEALVGWNIDGIYWVCENCHKLLKVDAGNNKRTLKAVQELTCEALVLGRVPQ